MTQRTQGELGLALSGGAVRGVAHIGVLRALGEHGIVPDIIAGTSAGAIVGALHAAGYTPPAMLEFFRAKNPFRLKKMALTKPGIFDLEKVVADFEEYFPTNTFESLSVPLRIVATDLLSGEAVVFDSGPLIPAVLASAAMPVVFTPTEIDGRMYADGGIVGNVPTELLEGRCRVMVGSHAGALRRYEGSELGSSLSILKRSLEIGMFQTSTAQLARCDVGIQPEGLERHGVFDAARIDAIEALGHEATRRRIPAIRQALHRARHSA